MDFEPFKVDILQHWMHGLHRCMVFPQVPPSWPCSSPWCRAAPRGLHLGTGLPVPGFSYINSHRIVWRDGEMGVEAPSGTRGNHRRRHLSPSFHSTVKNPHYPNRHRTEPPYRPSLIAQSELVQDNDSVRPPFSNPRLLTAFFPTLVSCTFCLTRPTRLRMNAGTPRDALISKSSPFPSAANAHQQSSHDNPPIGQLRYLLEDNDTRSWH